MNFRGCYWFLSNMYPCEVYGYNSVESAFQSQKSCGSEREKFACMVSGFVARREGKHLPLRKDWEQVKLRIMYQLVREKFRDPRLLSKLRAIKGPIAEDNTWGDRYWGVCYGRGENHLGRILMFIRDGGVLNMQDLPIY